MLSPKSGNVALAILYLEIWLGNQVQMFSLQLNVLIYQKTLDKK